MKRLLVPATVTGRAAAFTGVRVFAIVLAAASLGVVAGCGGEERLSREEFSDRLQSIDQRGSERWGRVAQRANDLKPDQPISADLKQPMRELVEFQRQAADELEELNPPEDAKEEVEKLIDALRERTEIFDHAIAVGRFTPPEFDQITKAGDKIDEAFQQLRDNGFLPKVEEHDGDT
jgi:mannitol-1-phosphate/altronate dehydrogenase